MGDPEPRDRETIRAGPPEPEPEATAADCGPDAPSDTLGRTLPAGSIQARPPRASCVHDPSVIAAGGGDLTHTGPTDSPPAQRPTPTIAGYRIGVLGRFRG